MIVFVRTCESPRTTEMCDRLPSLLRESSYEGDVCLPSFALASVLVRRNFVMHACLLDHSAILKLYLLCALSSCSVIWPAASPCPCSITPETS